MNFCECSGPSRQPSTYTQEGFTSRICLNCSRWLNPTSSITGACNRRQSSLADILGKSSHDD